MKCTRCKRDVPLDQITRITEPVRLDLCEGCTRAVEEKFGIKPTMTDTKELRETIDCSTQGTWVAVKFGMTGEWVIWNENGDVIAHGLSAEDAHAAVDARNAMPGLLDEVEQLRNQIQGIHKRLDQADKSRLKCRNLDELAVCNGLALGGIAVLLQHDFGPLPKPPEGV